MRFSLNQSYTQPGFDLTPFIDVIFLLIIFFMLVCQFFATEQFEAQLPDQIASSVARTDVSENATVSITFEKGEIRYAVGSDVLETAEPKLLEKMICSAINSRLSDAALPGVVSLRCDKRIPFERVRPALEAISQSRAQKIQWAVLP